MKAIEKKSLKEVRQWDGSNFWEIFQWLSQDKAMQGVWLKADDMNLIFKFHPDKNHEASLSCVVGDWIVKAGPSRYEILSDANFKNCFVLKQSSSIYRVK
jgi:hypothetical protein